MYEILDVNSTFEPNLLAEFQNLKDFHDRMQSLPTFAAYMKSDKFMARPFTGPMAHWGSD
jgi:glutathione S-transferase